MSEGMLVDREWLEKADATLNKQEAQPAPEYGKTSLFYDVRPARLQSEWTQNAAGVWKATARFIVNDRVDGSFTFDVYSLLSSKPPGVPFVERFFVVWRGRWEAVHQLVNVPRYVGGDHIQVSGAAGPNGYEIDNKGVCEVKTVTRGVADSYSDTGTLYLGGSYFKWGSSTLDIVGKKELWLVNAKIDVVTGVTQDGNGNVSTTKKRLTVLAIEDPS